MTIDWDAPENRPASTSIQPGQSVEGVITQLGFEPNLRGLTTLTWTLDNGRKRWANAQLWRCLADARVQIGDRIRVTRGQDEPSAGQYPRTTWTVERLTGPPAAPATGAPAAVQAQVPAW